MHDCGLDGREGKGKGKGKGYIYPLDDKGKRERKEQKLHILPM